MDELGHLGWVAHQSFELAGLLFGIRTNSRAFGRWLAKALPATLVRDEEAEPNYSAVIGGSDGVVGKRFHILYRDSTVLARTFDALELMEALLSDLEALTYWGRSEAVFVQATFLSSGGVRALFPRSSSETSWEVDGTSTPVDSSSPSPGSSPSTSSQGSCCPRRTRSKWIRRCWLSLPGQSAPSRHPGPELDSSVRRRLISCAQWAQRGIPFGPCRAGGHSMS